MPTVSFMEGKKKIKEVEVEMDSNLRSVALDNDVPVHHSFTEISSKIVEFTGGCQGFGLCGTCHVLIKEGMENCSPKGPREKMRLGLSTFSIGQEDEVRLSCQVKVRGNLTVQVCPEYNLTGDKFWE